MGDPSRSTGPGDRDMMTGFMNINGAPVAEPAQTMPSVTVTSTDANGAPTGEFPWEMIGLGLEEPLPPSDLMDEL